MEGLIAASKKKVVKKKKPVGRPTKFNELDMKKFELLYSYGFTDKQVATILEVKEQTINNWKKSNPNFFESLKNWKSIADEKIVRSLYNRAIGCTVKETKVGFFNGMATTQEVDKVILPDVTAIIFWLKNRQPEQWRDRANIDFDYKSAKDGSLIELAQKAIKKLNENKD